MKGAALMEKLLSRNDKLSRVALDQILKIGIPFNAPHSFAFDSITDDEVRIRLPNSKLNHNHIGGQHACAIATLGEFCAGMTIAKRLGMTQYRMILSRLSVEYHIQGRTALTGVARITDSQLEILKSEIAQNGKGLLEQKTEIFNTHHEKVADVATTWQVKPWTNVTLK